MDLRFCLESPEYLDILKKHFDVSGFLDDDTMILEVHEAYEGFAGIYVYCSKNSGRTLIMIHADTDYDELLLFSPLGTLETWSANSLFDAQIMGAIFKKMYDRNTTFRNKLINDLCEVKRKFNSSFKMFFDVDFDFFLECEEIAEINPFCIDRSSFKDLTSRISTAIEKFDKEKTEKFLDRRLAGPINAMREIFQKAGKKDEVRDELGRLRSIFRLRIIRPTHSTDEPLDQFLKRFNKKYPGPDDSESWCDLSIFVIQETSRIISKISGMLSQ